MDNDIKVYGEKLTFYIISRGDDNIDEDNIMLLKSIGEERNLNFVILDPIFINNDFFKHHKINIEDEFIILPATYEKNYYEKMLDMKMFINSHVSNQVTPIEPTITREYKVNEYLSIDVYVYGVRMDLRICFKNKVYSSKYHISKTETFTTRMELKESS